MRLTAVLSAMLCLQACAGKRAIVTTPPARCADLVPAEWSAGIEAAAVPDTAGLSQLAAEKLWAHAYLAQDGQLDKANGRTADAIAIFRKCEAMVNSARPESR